MTILGNFQRTWQLIGRHKCLPVWTVQRARPSKRLLLPQRRQVCHLLRSTLISWASWMKGPGDPPKQRTRLWCPFTRHWRRWWGRWASYGNSWTIWGWAHQQTPRSCCDWLRWRYACWGRLYGRQLTGGACCGWPVSWAISSRRRSSWRTLRTCQWQVVNCLGRNSWRGCTGRHKARNRPEWSRSCWGPRRSSARASQRPSGPFEGAPPSDVGQAKPPGGALSNASQAMGGALPQPPPPPLSSHLPLPAAVAEDVGLLPGHQDKPGMSMHQSAMAVEGQYGPMWPMNMVMSKTGELSPWEEVLALPWGPDPCSTDPVGGKVSKCLGNWKVVTSDPEILSLVEGVKLDFAQEPPLSQQVRRGPSFSVAQQKELGEQVAKMLEKGAIEKVVLPGPGFYAHLFLRPKKDGSMRPILNLKPLNRFVRYQHFKMENLAVATTIIQQNDWFTKLDLKDAYFAVSVHPSHRKYLRFVWDKEVYQFVSLPFGLASAPRVFTKLLKPVVSLLRRLRMRLVQYLDDGLFMSQDPLGQARDRDTALFVMMKLGFTVNWEKSELNPKQVIDFLGMTIDSHKMLLSLPPGKVQSIKAKCQQLLTLKCTTVRQVAKLVGKIAASVKAVVPGQLFCRQLQMLKTQGLLAQQQNYEAEITLTPECKEELQWWIECLDQHNGQSFLTSVPDMTIRTDASKQGWGAVMDQERTQGVWSQMESKLHINILELRAGNFAVRAFTRGTKVRHVHLLMDNSTAVAYVNNRGGTRSMKLIQEAKELWSYCLVNKITLTAEHLAGRLNVEADLESRQYRDGSNWKLDETIFQALGHIWGPMEMDLFADRLNKQLPAYASWKPDPMARVMDAFTCNWRKGLLYAFPPFCLISTEGEGRASADNSNLEHTDMVSPSAGHASRPTGAVASFTGAVNRANRGPPPATDSGQVATGGMASVRQDREDTRISDQATRLMYEARRPGTRKAYRHPWDDWVSWCEERHVDPVQAPVGVMANFLTHKFLTQALEYRTVNVYRSAISARHERVDGQPIGQHPTISQLMKGMFNRRPPQAKYTDTWDVELVLSRFRNMPENHDLELRELSLKLVMLLAITTTSRSSELHKIQVSTLVDKGDEIQFHIAGLTKSRKVGEGPMVIRVAQYEPEGKLDVTDCVRTYLGKTAAIRQPGVAGDQLLISFIPPHGPLAPSSVARWLKWGLRDAGIDTSKYQAHSTRAAATSKAALEGLNMSQILQQANWSRAATFKKYYHKSVGCLFQEKVLNKRWTFIIMSN